MKQSVFASAVYSPTAAASSAGVSTTTKRTAASGNAQTMKSATTTVTDKEETLNDRPAAVAAAASSSGGGVNFFHTKNGFVEGVEARKARIKSERANQRNTLQQWYGMKRGKLTKEVRQELELLRFSSYANPETKHLAPKRASGPLPEFFEFGYYAGTGKQRRRREKSFADTFLKDSPELLKLAERQAAKEARMRKKGHNKKVKTADARKDRQSGRRSESSVGKKEQRRAKKATATGGVKGGRRTA